MTFWIVRAGEKGEQEHTAIENNLVTIAWNELPDISGISDKPSLKRLWQKVYPHHKKAEAANMMGQVWNFLKQIEIGDLVGLPLKSRPSLMVGQVQSDYQFRQITNDTKHIRIVKWFGDIPKSEFDQDLIKSLRTYMTVFRVRKPNAEKRIRNTLHSILQDSPNTLIVKDQEIRSEFAVTSSDIPAILNEFRVWINRDEGQSHLSLLQKEKSDVRNILKKLHELDNNNPEFVEWVLYGLLPHSGSKNAKRASMFPAFWNIKSLFSTNYHYKDQIDWRNIADIVFELVSNFERFPQQIGEWIDKFVSNTVYSKGLQCGAISPILFCINDKFPIVNNRVIHTYNDFAPIFHWDDIMSPKLEEYINNIERCKKLITALGASELHDLSLFDSFCYWYDNFFKSEKEDEDDDDIGYEIAEKIKLSDVNFNEFLDSINIENISSLESHSLKNPEMVKVIDIIRECSAGRWVLPNFQRYFDWRRNDVREFLQSIFYDYYVGSLLLWEIGSKLPLEIMPIKGVEMKDESNAREIILDGQQRITSLWYAIKTPNFALKGGKTPLYFYINVSKYFSSENSDEIIEVLPRKLDYEESFDKLLFPFYCLEDFRKWVYDLETFLHKKVPDYYDKVRILRPVIEQKLSHIREGFEIPYITLPSTMELHDVTKIFERINTMGMLLNVFDLLIARLSIYTINLRELWENTIKEFPDIKRYNEVSRKLPIYIIQSISLCYSKTSSCKREEILDIYQRIFASKSFSFDDKWQEMSIYTNSTIQRLENLRDGFGVKDETELPFASMIPILAAILREIDHRENKLDCNAKLKMWYWCAVFSNAYSSAVESQLALDFKELKEWFNNDLKIPKTVDRARREVMTIDLRKVQVQSSAIYRGVLSLLALKGAHDFDTNQTLELARSNHKDHIFPRSKFALKDDLNSVLNMTWMSDETNMEKGSKRPSQFCERFTREKYSSEKEFQVMLKTHCINSLAYQSMLKDDFEVFIVNREDAILSEIRHKIGIQEATEKSTLISPGKPFTNMVIMRSTIRNCDEYIHWIDKYFSNEGLELLVESVNKRKVSSIKILSAIPNTNLRLKKSYERFKEEMKNDSITCDFRILIDYDDASKLHDRWILSKNVNYNIPSPDVVARGQYSEVNKTDSTLPFEDLWKKGFDIISRWNEIDRAVKEYNDRKRK